MIDTPRIDMFALLLTWLLPITEGYLIGCSSTNCAQTNSCGTICTGQTVNCVDHPDGDNTQCKVYCYLEGCDGTTINCAPGIPCHIFTGSDRAARNAQINGKYASGLSVSTGDYASSQLYFATITCPDNGDCSFWCTDGGSGFYNCAYMDVHAENSNKLTIACRNTNDVCKNIDIWCPDQNIADSCVINGSPDTASVRSANIRSKYGFNTFKVNYVENQQSIGTMRCLDGYSSSCIIDKTTQNQCQNGPTACDILTTTDPTVNPTNNPTTNPTVYPTTVPTATPTIYPTINPTKNPTENPTKPPTNNPTSTPTTDPTSNPTKYPTTNPTTNPTVNPTEATKNPTINPTNNPSLIPTMHPTRVPTSTPTNPTNRPTTYPTYIPTYDPTSDPTYDPTSDPTYDPTSDPTYDPTYDPTADPTFIPTSDPTADPTANPTANPTVDPTSDPTANPTSDPTSDPTADPTVDPTADPTSDPTADPTADPTYDPTSYPTVEPTSHPTVAPTKDPTLNPTEYPSKPPSYQIPTIYRKLHFICYYNDDKEFLINYFSLSEYASMMMEAIINSTQTATLQPFYYDKAQKNPLAIWSRGGILDFMICNIFSSELMNLNVECPMYNSMHSNSNSNSNEDDEYISIGVFEITADAELEQYENWLIRIFESDIFMDTFSANMNAKLNQNMGNSRKLFDYDSFEVTRIVIIDPLNYIISTQNDDNYKVSDVNDGASFNSMTIVIILICVFIAIIISAVFLIFYIKRNKQKNENAIENMIEMETKQNHEKEGIHHVANDKEVKDVEHNGKNKKYNDNDDDGIIEAVNETIIGKNGVGDEPVIEVINQTGCTAIGEHDNSI